jgi:hypothetical protein
LAACNIVGHTPGAEPNLGTPSNRYCLKLFRSEEIAGDFRGTSFARGNMNLLQNHILDYSNDVLVPFICSRRWQLPG